jgi:hypothetical protein
MLIIRKIHLCKLIQLKSPLMVLKYNNKIIHKNIKINMILINYIKLNKMLINYTLIL